MSCPRYLSCLKWLLNDWQRRPRFAQGFAAQSFQWQVAASTLAVLTGEQGLAGGLAMATNPVQYAHFGGFVGIKQVSDAAAGKNLALFGADAATPTQ